MAERNVCQITDRIIVILLVAKQKRYLR